MNRLQAITYIRESATDNHTHRVIEIRARHLFYNTNGFYCAEFHEKDLLNMYTKQRISSDKKGEKTPVLLISLDMRREFNHPHQTVQNPAKTGSKPASV
jgi:hypothetical protein